MKEKEDESKAALRGACRAGSKASASLRAPLSTAACRAYPALLEGGITAAHFRRLKEHYEEMKIKRRDETVFGRTRTEYAVEQIC